MRGQKGVRFGIALQLANVGTGGLPLADFFQKGGKTLICEGRGNLRGFVAID
jgi:hypothetical protein